MRARELRSPIMFIVRALPGDPRGVKIQRVSFLTPGPSAAFTEKMGVRAASDCDMSRTGIP